MTTTKSSPRSLVEFARAKRRAGCKVCALPKVIREQLKEAREKKIPRETQIAWLKAECGVTLTGAEMDQHRMGRHDYE